MRITRTHLWNLLCWVQLLNVSVTSLSFHGVHLAELLIDIRAEKVSRGFVTTWSKLHVSEDLSVTYVSQVDAGKVLGPLVRVVPVEPVPELADIVLGRLVEQRTRSNCRDVVVKVASQMLMSAISSECTNACPAC